MAKSWSENKQLVASLTVCVVMLICCAVCVWMSYKLLGGQMQQAQGAFQNSLRAFTQSIGGGIAP